MVPVCWGDLPSFGPTISIQGNVRRPEGDHSECELGARSRLPAMARFALLPNLIPLWSMS